MSGHYASCPKSGPMALYASCECEAISRREHTRALEEQTQALREAAQVEGDLRQRVEELERQVQGLLDRFRQPPDVASWL